MIFLPALAPDAQLRPTRLNGQRTTLILSVLYIFNMHVLDIFGKNHKTFGLPASYCPGNAREIAVQLPGGLQNKEIEYGKCPLCW